MRWLTALKRRFFGPKEVHIWKTKDDTEIPVHEMTDEHLVNAYKMCVRNSIINFLHTIITEEIGVPSYIVQDYETQWDHWANWCRILGEEVRIRELTEEIKEYADELEQKAHAAYESGPLVATATIRMIQHNDHAHAIALVEVDS